MADWRAVTENMNQGYLLGKDAGGKMSGIGMALSKIADSIKTNNDENQKKNLLGYEGLIRGNIAPAQEGDTNKFNVPGIGNIVSNPGMPLYEKDATGNYVQKGIIPKGSKVVSSGTTQGKLQSIVDMTDKTPDQIQEEVKSKDPAYFSFLKSINEGRDVAKYSRYGDQNQIHQDVNTLWPDFDASLQPARVATRKGFVAGKEAQNIRSLNTAVQHLGELDGLIPQLQNIGFRPGNTVKNFISKNAGKTPVTNFNMVKNALSGELATIFKNTGGTDQEIANISQSIDNANSTEQLKGVVHQATALMSGRMAALDSQWKGVFGQESNSPNPIMNEKSKNTLIKLGLGDYLLGNQNQDQKTTSTNQPDIVTIQYPTGQTLQMPREEATKRGLL